MNLPKGLRTNRAFIKKAYTFFKFYPKTRENPAQMLLKTLTEIIRLINRGDVNQLEPLSKKAQLVGNYSNPKELFQIEIIGEKGRFVIYKPTKLLESGNNCGEIAYIHDLLYIG